MVDFNTGNFNCISSNIIITRNTKYDDIDNSLYTEYGCNNSIYKKILLKNQEFYNTKCSIGLFFINNRIERVVIYNEIHYFNISTWLSKENSLIVKEKNQELLLTKVPKELINIDEENKFIFKWGSLTSIYDPNGGFSSIEIKY